MTHSRGSSWLGLKFGQCSMCLSYYQLIIMHIWLSLNAPNTNIITKNADKPKT